MKCALELIAMHAFAKEEHRLEEERLDLEAKQTHEKRIQSTVNFCETVVSAELEKRAKQYNREICFDFKAISVIDRLGNKGFKLIKDTNTYYANGDVSEEPSGDTYDLNTLVNYLNAHCINVEINEKTATYKQYGLGVNRCDKFKIYV